MVLNNVTKFHKILIKSIQFRERTSSGQTLVRTDGRTGVTLNAPAIIMAGAKYAFILVIGKQQLKFAEIVMVSALHLAPTIHIIVVILSKYLQRVQFDEKAYH